MVPSSQLTEEVAASSYRIIRCSANLRAMYVLPVPLEPQRMIRRWSSNSDTYLCKMDFGTSVSNANESTLCCLAPVHRHQSASYMTEKGDLASCYHTCRGLLYILIINITQLS